MVIFICGIHGSGKGTLCKKISSQTGIPHFTASDVLKWSEVSPNMQNKNVVDIPETQNRLLLGLEKLKEKHQSFILDGHFCLFNKEGDVEKISVEVFEKISPNFIVLVSANSDKITARLKARDNVKYSEVILKQMQKIEQEYSKQVAQELKIPYFQIIDENLIELLTAITN